MQIETFEDCTKVCSRVLITQGVDWVEISGYFGRATNTKGFNSCEFKTTGKDFQIAQKQLITYVQALVYACDAGSNLTNY